MATNNRPQLALVLLAIVGFLVVVAGLAERDGSPRRRGDTDAGAVASPPGSRRGVPDGPGGAGESGGSGRPAPAPLPEGLPGGGRRVFGDGAFLVAYYGTAGTGVLGVLGETAPDRAAARVRRAGRPFVRPGERLQPVFEMIVTVADRGPGPDGDHSHDVDRARVAAYVRAAQRTGTLLLLDLQPGRSGFLPVARRWEWALRHPWVGLALDPEWRMHGRRVPGRVVGWVTAEEVNRTSAWLARLVRRHDLPQKLFVVHQFRTSMVHDIHRVRARRELAMVQHVDGFGTPGQKRATYHAVAHPRRFTMGFKLFYDEDVRRMDAAAVRAMRPPVRFVSFQ